MTAQARILSLAVLTSATLTACGDPCLDDGLIQDGSQCPQSGADAGAAQSATDSEGHITDSGSAGNSAGNSAGMDDSGDDADSGSQDDTAGSEGDSNDGDQEDTGDSAETGDAGQDIELCRDRDGDGFGGQECRTFDEDPGDPWVDNDDDCDDDDPMTHPGAAKFEPDLCAKDHDDDDWGDNDPPHDNVDPGDDCDDDDPRITPKTIEGQECLGVEPLRLEVEDEYVIAWGDSVRLFAEATGGSGRYDWHWSPARTLDDPSVRRPTASPDSSLYYDVTVTDREFEVSRHESVLVRVEKDVDWSDCREYELEPQIIYGNEVRDAEWTVQDRGKRTCQWANNRPSAMICDHPLRSGRFAGTFDLRDAKTEDDWIGFIWGLDEDKQSYYLFEWKGAYQRNHGGCNTPRPFHAGMYVKRIDASAGQVTCHGLGQLDDDGHAYELLAGPDDFRGDASRGGWDSSEKYRFELVRDGQQAEIRISTEDGEQLSRVTVPDDQDPNAGKWGAFSFSQDGACFDEFTIEDWPAR